MKIVCSASMPFAEEAFGTLGDTTVLEGRAITADDVRDADILAIRSTTKVNEDLLTNSRAKFVGTAAIGTDHMDIEYLEKREIAWCAAPGCNANSVSEYIASALLCLAERHDFKLVDKTIGVVGVGNVGSLVVRKAETLGMCVLQNDPPRQRSEVRGQRSEVASLDRVLEEADIVTLHVPLTAEGQDATVHMADQAFFAKMKPNSILINSARGAVVDSDAFLAAIDNGVVQYAVIDTWENEPEFRKDIFEKIGLGTPHVAGYSFEGKVTGTVVVYREACRVLGIKPTWTPEPLMPPAKVPEVEIDAGNRADQDVLHQIVSSVYAVEDDDRRLREGTVDDPIERAKHFDSLRKNYPMRREFRFTKVILKNASSSLATSVKELGFELELSGGEAG